MRTREKSRAVKHLLWAFAFISAGHVRKKKNKSQDLGSKDGGSEAQYRSLFRKTPLLTTERLGVLNLGCSAWRWEVLSLPLWHCGESADRGQEVRQYKVAGIQAGNRLGVNKCLHGRDTWGNRPQSKAAENGGTRLLCPLLSLAS